MEAKDVNPFAAGIAINHLSAAIDELVYASCGYKPSEHQRMLKAIARFAMIVRHPNASDEAKAEYNKLVDKYEEEWKWLQS